MVEWRPILGFEGLYEVSDAGGFRSIDRIVAHSQGPLARKGRELAQDVQRGGYLVLSMNRGGKQYRMQAHRAVLLAFVGPAPEGMEACHNNGVRTDNRVSNLRWDTKSANAADRKRYGTEHNANKTHCKNGHEFTPDNTYMERSRTHRMCRECARARDRKRCQDATARPCAEGN